MDGKRTYRDTLVQQVRDCGQELIDRADTMIGDGTTMITNFSITVIFEQGSVPLITYTTSVVNKTALRRLNNETQMTMEEQE